MMENAAEAHVDAHAELPVQVSDNGTERSADDADMEDPISEASTDAYGSNDDAREYLSDDEDGESSADMSLEVVLGEESAQILRLIIVFTREMHTEIVSAQARLNRIRTRLVRRSYGRNTSSSDDLYSFYLHHQTKLEYGKVFLQRVHTRLDECRNLLALHGIHLE